MWAGEWGNESREPEVMNRLAEEKRKPALAYVRRNDDGSCAIHGLEDHVRAVGGMIQCVIARCDLKTGSWQAMTSQRGRYYHE